MTGDQLYGAIGLAVILLGVAAMVFAIRADSRARRAHDAWQTEFHEWLWGGMQGPPALAPFDPTCVTPRRNREAQP